MSNQKQNNGLNVPHQQNGAEPLDTRTTSADALPGGLQAIATAYGDYTKSSFEDTKSLVEALSSARSFDRAIEVQTEFAKRAYGRFVADSQKIAALYGEFVRSSYRPIDGFVAKMTSPNQ